VNPAHRRHAPATLRNRAPIADVLRTILPAAGRVLEIASGSGEHAVHFAAAFPGIVWQPSDVDPDCLASIRAWSAEAALPNLESPLTLDVRILPWPVLAESYDAVVSINMIHIAPFECCQALMAGAVVALKAGGRLMLYGPFKIDGHHTAPSNAAFDANLQVMDPRFGVRDLAEVLSEAALRGFVFERRVEMPANNLSLLFRKAS
jgi:cyclopropane fatty-acyl-phospholipid synthase-like methyltransferase